jgi:hypothetical protein
VGVVTSPVLPPLGTDHRRERDVQSQPHSSPACLWLQLGRTQP